MHEELKERLKQIEIDYSGKSFYSVFVAGSLRTPDLYKDRGFDARRKGVQVWVTLNMTNSKELSTTAQIS